METSPMSYRNMLLFAFLTCVMFENIRGLVNEKYYILDTTFVDQLCDSSFITFEATSRSFIECANLCTKHSNCGSMILHGDNQTCFGINIELACVGYSSTLQGAKFYRPPSAQQCGVDLVSGPYGVADDKLIGSTTFDTGITYRSKFVRLDHEIHWSPKDLDTQQYIQVEFPEVRSITDVITQGGIYAGHSHWVKSYKFLYSYDCVTYTTVKDSNGQEKVFPGNTDGSSYVTNTLDTPVLGRCVRLNPRTWNEWSCMRLGVLGCI